MSGSGSNPEAPTSDDRVATDTDDSDSNEPKPRHVERDEALGSASGHEAGQGTYVADGVIRARYEGDFVVDGKSFCVRRERRPLPRRRLRRGEKPHGEGSKGEATAGRGAATHRHGTGKHGRLRGKPKKGMGDQGTWD